MMLPLVRAQYAAAPRGSTSNLADDMIIVIHKLSAAIARQPGITGKRHDNASR
jgi:hypothetical protein